MRAAEFLNEYAEHFNGIDLSLEIQKDDEYVDDEDTDNQTVYVKATANGKELGHVLFTFDYDAQGQYLYPQDLEVEERFRGQGIAQTMYDYVKSKGYRIKRSGQQTDAGAGFWAKHRPEQNVWEDELNESRDALFNWLKQQFPTWPDYVLKDFLYPQAKGIRDRAELEDFLKRNKQDFGQVKWRLENLPITLDIFTPKTQRMIRSRAGGSSNPFGVPKDAERHAQQSKMIQQQGVRTEPIIVAKLNNGYDLIEGWHRTIQHLKSYPQGYTGPAWVGYGATYQSN